jgi:tRNA threonylcarbamoyladenosine biosynthesis protein TsaB
MDNYLLHIETATKVCSVAISKNGELLALKELNEDQYSHGEVLTLFIDEIITSCQINYTSLKAISVSSGPGSYTGLRIGVSTAKGLCYALKIPLIAIDSLSALALLAKDVYPGKRICAAIDARRMEIFNAVFSENQYLLKPISADIVDENSYQAFIPFVVVGDANEKLKEIWKDREVIFADEIHASAKGQVEYAYEKYLQQIFEDVAYFEPFYLKDFVSTQKIKDASSTGN